jgi:hypothetical protein
MTVNPINPIKPSGDQNAGRAKALGVIDDYTKLLIALATGVVALSAVFLDNFYRGHDVWSVELAWIFCGVSALAGILARGAYVSQLAAGALRPRRETLELLNMLQWITLVVGVVFLGNAVIANVNAAPTVFGLSAQAPISSGASAVEVACRTGDSGGCSLQVHVSTTGVPITAGATTIVEIPSDTASSVHVALPRSIVLAARATGHASGVVTISASGRIGSTSTTVFDMTFTKNVVRTATKPAATAKSGKKKKKGKHAVGATGATTAVGATG